MGQHFSLTVSTCQASQVTQWLNNMLAIQETRVQFFFVKSVKRNIHTHYEYSESPQTSVIPRQSQQVCVCVCVCTLMSSFLKTYKIQMLYRVWASLIAQLVKNPPAMQKPSVGFLGREDLLEKG